MKDIFLTNWHEITIIFLVLVAGLIEIYERKSNKRQPLLGKILLFCFVGIAIASLLKLYDSHKEASEYKQLQTDLLRSQKELEKLIAGTLNRDTAAQSKRELALKQYEDAFASSAIEAEKWKSKFYNGLTDQQREFRKARLNDSDASEQLSIKWYPVAKLISDQFVTRAAAVAAEDQIEFKYEEFIDAFTHKRYPSMKIIGSLKKGNNELIFTITQGYISANEFRPCQIHIYEPRFGDGLLFYFKEDEFEMRTTGGRYKDLLERYRTESYPLDNENFLPKLNEFFNTFFEVWIIELRETQAEQDS
jgi:hypothetical protein